MALTISWSDGDRPLSPDGLCPDCSRIDFANWQFRRLGATQGWASGLHVQSLKHLGHNSGCRLCAWLTKIEPHAGGAIGITAYSTLTSVAHAKGSGAAAIFSSQIVGVEDSTILAVSDDPVHSLERRSFAIQPKSPVETPNCITSSIRDTFSRD